MVETHLKCATKLAMSKTIDNTIVFSIFEGKDSRSNLRLCLSKYKDQIEKLASLTWQNHTMRIFLFGDYEFLCVMYGQKLASLTWQNHTLRIFLFGDYEFLCVMYGIPGANGKYFTPKVNKKFL